MADTQPLAPTDAEIIALLRPLYASDEAASMGAADDLRTARAVLEKWGNPAVAGEQVGWMWQHDETGRTGFVDCWQVENGWQDGNPRLRLISKLYATPQPTQAQAGAVPLTDEQIEALPLWKRFVGLWPETRREIVRTIERHHGIKGGQHGESV